MTPTEPAKSTVSKIIKKAKNSLSGAKHLFNEGHFDFAASRAYYAVFYALVSVLSTKDLQFKKHSSVIGSFNKHFIRTGIFPQNLSKQINRLFQERTEADYDWDAIIEKNDARQDIKTAEEIVSQIIEYLTRNGFIKSSGENIS